LLGWDEQRTLAKVDAIYDTLMNIFEVGQKEKIMTTEAADRLVEKILGEGQRA
jgi:hypothetical protein